MAGGRSITKSRIAKLDELGEEEVFADYLEVGSVAALMRRHFKPHGEGATVVGKAAFYEWLRAEDGRHKRWDQLLDLRGQADADEAVDVARSATPENHQAKKLEVDTLKWRAGKLSARYGDRRSLTLDVGDNLATAWLEALKGADEARRLQARTPEIIEAEIIEEAGDDQTHTPDLPPNLDETKVPT